VSGSSSIGVRASFNCLQWLPTAYVGLVVTYPSNPCWTFTSPGPGVGVIGCASSAAISIGSTCGQHQQRLCELFNNLRAVGRLAPCIQHGLKKLLAAEDFNRAGTVRIRSEKILHAHLCAPPPGIGADELLSRNQCLQNLHPQPVIDIRIKTAQNALRKKRRRPG